MSKVEGLDRLKHKLTQSIPQRAKEVTRQAMEKSAEEIVKAMRQLVPKGETRKAEESIGWTWGEAPAGSFVVATGRFGEYGTMRLTIYAGGGEAFYARFLEFGTQKMAAQPFFFPAYRLNRKRASGRIKRAIKKGIKEASQ